MRAIIQRVTSGRLVKTGRFGADMHVEIHNDGPVTILIDTKINNPDASVGVCCSHKVVAVGFNTLRYDASVGVLNPPHE